MNVKNAVASSIKQNGEVVACGFAGDFGDLFVFVSDTFADGQDAVFVEENDGTIDVADYDFDWRIKVTLTDE